MQTLMQPLRDEHAALVPHIEGIRRVTDAIGVVPVAALRKEIAGVREFLSRQLIPHARAEDVAMYPVVGRAIWRTRPRSSRRRLETQALPAAARASATTRRASARSPNPSVPTSLSSRSL